MSKSPIVIKKKYTNGFTPEKWSKFGAIIMSNFENLLSSLLILANKSSKKTDDAYLYLLKINCFKV